jgi:hypothetical protein
VYIGRHVDLTLHNYGCPNTAVQGCEGSGISYEQCGPFFKHCKSKKHCLQKDLESSLAAWFQTHAYDAIHGTTVIEASFIAACLRVITFMGFSSWMEI